MKELDLSYHFISKIENLDSCQYLTDLNLAENSIRKIENLKFLVNLVNLNLTGNAIREIPRDEIEPLQQLKSCKLSRNKIKDLKELGNLAVLGKLESVWVFRNPVADNPDFNLYLVYHVPNLTSIDGSAVSPAIKQKAARKYQLPAPENWMVRENLVSFRRELSEMQERKRGINDEIEMIDQEIISAMREKETIQEEIETATYELKDINKALKNNSSEQIKIKKFKMKELLTKAEELRDLSVDLQNKISKATEQMLDKEGHLKEIRLHFQERSLGSSYSENEAILQEEEREFMKDIEKIKKYISNVEQKYGEVVDELSWTTEKITSLETDILDLRESLPRIIEDDTPRWKEKRKPKESQSFKISRKSEDVRMSKSFGFDYDTEMYLNARKEQIDTKLPSLQTTLNELERRLETLHRKKTSCIEELKETDSKIAELRERITENESYLSKHPFTSPSRPAASNREMWDNLKQLWGMVSSNPWEGESDDIPRAVSKWASTMKDYISKFKADSESLIQLSAQDRISKATISHLEKKVQELTDEKIKMQASQSELISQLSMTGDKDFELKEIAIQNEEILQENESLKKELDHAKSQIDHYRDSIKKLNEEISQLTVQVKSYKNRETSKSLDEMESRILEGKLEELRQGHEKVIKEYEQRQLELQQKVNQLEMNLKISDNELSEKQKELKHLSDTLKIKGEEYDNLLLSTKREKNKLDELMLDVNKLKRAKQEVEEELYDVRGDLYSQRPHKEDYEEREILLDAFRRIGDMLDIEVQSSRSSMSSRFTYAIEEALQQIQRQIKKAQTFKKNKQKFVEMYEKNTHDLQTEWDNLKQEKEKLKESKDKIASLKSEYENVQAEKERLSQLNLQLTTKTNNLQNEVFSYEEQLNALKDSIQLHESTKQKVEKELEQYKALCDREAKRYEECMLESKTMRREISDMRKEKNELEDTMNSLINRQKRLEAKLESSEEELRGYEELCGKVSLKLKDEEDNARRELEKTRQVIIEKKNEVEYYEHQIDTLEAKFNEKEQELTSIRNKMDNERAEWDTLRDQLRDKKDKLHEIEFRTQTQDKELTRLKQLVEEAGNQISIRNSQIIDLEKEIFNKERELEKVGKDIEATQDQHNREMKKINETLNELSNIEEELLKLQKERDYMAKKTHDLKDEAAQYEFVINEKVASIQEQDSLYIEINKKIEAENEYIKDLRRESIDVVEKLNHLKAALASAEDQKKRVMHEVEELNSQITSEEYRHRNELERLKIAISNGESTLRQLIDAVTRTKSRLQSEREEAEKAQKFTEELHRNRQRVEEDMKYLLTEYEALKEAVDKLKEEQDTALVLLALSGHKIDDAIKARISELCRSALEVERLKGIIEEIQKDNSRPRESIRFDELESTVLYPADKKDNRRMIQSIDDAISNTSSFDFAKLPENEEMRKLLLNLESTQQRLKEMIPVSDVSFEGNRKK